MRTLFLHIMGTKFSDQNPGQGSKLVLRKGDPQAEIWKTELRQRPSGRDAGEGGGHEEGGTRGSEAPSPVQDRG